jgi:hypothetical protein
MIKEHKIMENIPYETARQNLEELQCEALSLPSNLTSAMEAGNARETIRLKAREKDIFSEILSARISFMKARIEKLEADLAITHKILLQAQLEGKKADIILAEEAIGSTSNAISKAKKEFTSMAFA